MNKTIRNLTISTLLFSVAAYAVYRIYKKKKKEEENKRTDYVLREYTVIGRHDFSNNNEEKEQSKVM